MDIRLNENFDFELDHRNDMAMVTGREAFEQALRIRLTSAFRNIVGEVNWELIPELLRIEAERVAADMGELESVAAFSFEESETRPNTVEIAVVYQTGDEFSDTISE